MTTSQISLLALILVGGIGILLIGVSMLMKAVARRKAKGCTAATTGTVIDHRFMGEGRMYPVLEYTVDGTQYQQLWPLGSQMTVHYNPGNPSKSYVERPIVGNFATLMFNIAGFLLIAMSILLYVLIQR